MPKTSGVSPLAKNNTVSDSFWNSKEKNNASQNANDNEVSVVKGVKDREVESEQDKATINDTCYAEQLTALNISFLNWIKLHIEKNPLVDLTPVFNDYTKHMKDVEGKYGKPTKSDVHAKPAAKDANVIHLTNSEKQAAPGLGTVPNFGSVKQEPGEISHYCPTHCILTYLCSCRDFLVTTLSHEHIVPIFCSLRALLNKKHQFIKFALSLGFA